MEMSATQMTSWQGRVLWFAEDSRKSLPIATQRVSCMSVLRCARIWVVSWSGTATRAHGIVPAMARDLISKGHFFAARRIATLLK